MNLNSRAPTTLSTSGDFTWIITELLTKKKSGVWKNEATSLYADRDLQGLRRHLKIPTFFQMSP